MKLLPYGQSFLHDQEHAYQVYAFVYDDLSLPPGSICPPDKQEMFSRLYPHRIGMMGVPGDTLAIVRRNAQTRSIEFQVGYIKSSGWPLFFTRTFYLSKPQLWDPKQPVGLQQDTIAWVQERVDRITLKVRKLSEQHGRERQEAKEQRSQARKNSRTALNQHRRRVHKEREAWKKPILANLQAVCRRLYTKAELDNLFSLWDYL